MVDSWREIEPGEPVRCPGWRNGRRCNRAQDLTGEMQAARIRVTTERVTEGLERVCRSCGSRLEIRLVREDAYHGD